MTLRASSPAFRFPKQSRSVVFEWTQLQTSEHGCGLVRFCLNNTSFLYGSQPYQQLDVLAMGSPLSPAIADIFMVDLEEKAIAGAGEDIAPSVWKRYVDDILSVVKRNKGHLLQEHLNAQHK